MDISATPPSTPSSHGGGPKDLLIAQLNDLLRMKSGIITSLRKEVETAREGSNRAEEVSDMKQRLEILERKEHDQISLLRSKDNMLKLARQEIAILKQQIEQDKDTFEKTYQQIQALQRKQQTEQTRIKREQDELQHTCDEQQDLLQRKDDEILLLKAKLQKVKDVHKRELQELDVKHKQELFIASKLNDHDVRRKR
eukprot:TRINITY_DN2829_c0_g1_i1.p1 TRINITY_DN2829_c0_g1~~TRINITY_DN2829_c0_g1_i1.p1  ORF type:complete len:210 (+),score=42.71 TRINITY_DN2829_c0_g1_i1:40-630(+)